MFVSCTSDSPVTPTPTGTLVRYDSIGYYDKARIQSILGSGLDKFFTQRTMQPDEFRGRLSPARHGVTLHKVTYTSVIPEKSNQVVTAYGLVAIPDSILPGAPMVSYQHGTIFDRSACPSNPNGSDEIQFQLSQFASQGYIVIAADYFGTTAGTLAPNGYGIVASTAQACLDMLKAAKQLLEQKNITPGKLFLNGWSQGGASTNVFLRRLELEQIPVAAAVTASGPADQVIFLGKAINEPTDFTAPYFPAVIGNILFAYEAYLGFDGYPALSIRPEYLEASRKLYNFEIPFEEYLTDVLIDTNGKWRPIQDIFTQKFLDESKAATSPFWKTLEASEGYRWQMRTPYRCFYSNRDEAVVADAARKILDYQKSIGNTSIEGFDAGPRADHGSVYIESIINAKSWFDSLK